MYGYDQRLEVLGGKGMLQAGNLCPVEVVSSRSEGVSSDLPEPFFLERYRVAYAAEIAHFVHALTCDEPARTTIDDGVKALELAEPAMQSWRRGSALDVSRGCRTVLDWRS